MTSWSDVTPQYYDGSSWQNVTPQYYDGSSWQPSAVQLYGSASGDTTPPVVAFTAPAAGATISATQTLTGTVSDDVAVASVTIKAGNTALGRATIASGSWSLGIDTTGLPNGNSTVTATASDSSGNSASANRSFIVANVAGGGSDITGPYTEPIYTQETTSSITGTLITPDSTKFTYLGVDSMSDPGTVPGFYRPPFIVGTSSTTGNIPAYSVKFNFSGQVLELYYTTRGSGEEIRVCVNGKWKAQNTTAPYKSTAASGAATYLKLDFGSAATRTIQFDMLSWFGGVKVADVSTITPAATPSFKVVCLSDSLAGAKNKGRGQNSNDYTNISSYFLQAAQNVGWKHRYNESIGGSGFYVSGDGGGSGAYINRVNGAIIARNPNAVLFDAHVFNDLQANKTPAQETTGLTNVLSAMRAGVANANIICALTPLPPALTTALGSQSAAIATIKSYNDPMLPVAAQFNCYAINPLDGNVYDVDGTLLGNPNGGMWTMPDGSVSYPSTYLTSDGVHPTEAGSFWFAAQVSAALQLIMAQPSWKGATSDGNGADTTPPSVPVLQTPSATSTAITLTWTASTDNTAVAGYNVYRTGVKQNSSLITTPTYTQTSLSPSTSYGPYAVSAADTSGNESSQSNTQTITTAPVPNDTTPPTVPTGLSATPTSGGFTATWNASTDAVGVAGYNVYIGSNLTTNTTVTSYTASGLVNGSTYSLQVSAYDAAGNESAKTTAVPVTPAANNTAPNPPTNLAVVGGDAQLRITWTAPASGAAVAGYNIYVGGSQVATSIAPSIMLDGMTNGTTYTVAVAAYDASGNASAQTAGVSDTPQPASASGAPTEVASFGPNGTHYPDRTPWLYGTASTVVECDCTWAAIKTAINNLTDAQVNAGARVNIRPGSLPGSGGSSGSPAMMDTVGKLAWRKRVLLTPRDGISSVTFANNFRVNKIFNVAFVGFDTRPYGAILSGCSYSAMAWMTMRYWRVVGIGGTVPNTTTPSGMITEGFDTVEVVVPDVQVGDSDPTGYGSGYPGPAGNAGGNGWLRFCRGIGNYIAPQYLPIPAYDANGNQTAGYGHNDDMQLYGSSVYYGFILRDSAHFGCNNSAFQIGGWPSSGDTNVGPIAYFMKLYHCLLLNATVGANVRYPVPTSTAQALTTANCINGIGRNGQHYAYGTITAGSNYTTNWAVVNNSRSTATPRPSVVGAWTEDDAIASWSSTTINRICPVPDSNWLSAVWSATPPAQIPPTIPPVNTPG